MTSLESWATLAAIGLFIIGGLGGWEMFLRHRDRRD